MNSTDAHWRPGRIASALLLLVALALYGSCQVHAPLYRLGLHSNDFKHLHLGSCLLRSGESPYDPIALRKAAALQNLSINPYVYLPFTAQAMRPLSYLPLDRAATTWFFLNHAFLLVALGGMASGLPAPWRGAGFALLLGAAALSFSLTRTLTAGQMNLALLAALTLAWRLARVRRDAAAGLAVAFAALFKIAPAAIVLTLIPLRRWRLLAWTAGWGLALLAASLLDCGWGRYREFLPVLADMGYGRSTWGDVGFDFYRAPFNQSINAFLHRTLADNPTTMPWLALAPVVADRLTLAATALIALAILGPWLAPGAAARSKSAPALFDLDFALAVLLMLLAPSLYWDHYAILLILPVFLVLAQKPGWISAAILILGYGLTAAPQGLFQHWSGGRGAGVLLYSMGLWGTLAILAVAIAERGRVLKRLSVEGHGQPEAERA